VSSSEYFVETLLGGFSHLNTHSDFHTYYSSTVDYAMVHIDQTEIESSGNLNADDAAVNMDVHWLLSGDVYVSQGAMLAVDGSITARNAHVAVTATDIGLVNSYSTSYEHTYHDDTVFGGAFTSYENTWSNWQWNEALPTLTKLP